MWMKNSSLHVISKASSPWAGRPHVFVRVIKLLHLSWRPQLFQYLFNLPAILAQAMGLPFFLTCYSVSPQTWMGTLSSAPLIKHKVPSSPQTHVAKTHGICAGDSVTLYMTSSIRGSGATKRCESLHKPVILKVKCIEIT